MSIKDRLSKKTADLMVPPKSDQAASTGGSPLRTGPGQMLMVNSLMRESNEKVAQLEARLKEFDESVPVKLLDTALIVSSKWANRINDSFISEDFALLKEEIRQSQGNVQPIKVRPVAGGAQPFEIVFGHRRHRACKDLGLPVLAVIESVSDMDLFKEMERENRTRKDLSPWEQGQMYRRALHEQLFSSQDQLARELGVDPGNLSKALRLANIDERVVKAFASPLDLQFRFAKPLSDALQRDPEGVFLRAAQLSNEVPRRSRSAKEVLALLVETAETASAMQKTDNLANIRIVSKANRTTIEIASPHVTEAKLASLRRFLDDWLVP